MYLEDTNVHGRLKDAVLAAFEDVLGFVLPEDYRRFLLKHNGGRPVPSNFSIGGYDVSSVESFYGLHDGPDYARLDVAYNDLANRLPDGVAPVASDSFGNQVCVACRPWQYGRILFWDHETEDVTELAEDFDAFLDSLFEWVDPNELPMWKIARTNDVGALRTIASSPSEIEVRDKYDRTMLENAAIWGRTEMVRILLEAGAELRDARRYARENKHTELLAFLDSLDSA